MCKDNKEILKDSIEPGIPVQLLEERISGRSWEPYPTNDIGIRRRWDELPEVRMFNNLENTYQTVKGLRIKYLRGIRL